MTRLLHSNQGYLRSMQISGHSLFVFVEGQLDRYFTERLCDAALGSLGVNYIVRLSAELPGGTGGKPGLLRYRDYLHGRPALRTSLQGKLTVVAFILDKDID